MPALLQSMVAHGEEDVLPMIMQRTGHPPRLSTAFESCKFYETRSKGRWDNRPCRKHEESSCNKVHATCARVLKKDITGVSVAKYKLTFDQKQPPCKPPLPPPDPAAAGKTGGMMSGMMAGMVASASTQRCNARLEDYPYGLMNPEAVKDEKKTIAMALGLKRAVFASPAQTVWGLSVHGKSGTYAFDNHGTHATDYIYKIKQPNGLAPDYYVCDSRTSPQHCALIGGNMQHNCAEWYDPRMCNFCQDHGAMLTCQIRGWSSKFMEWARVPIYPRDLLGEMYRGEFRDVAGRPMWATITLPKELLRNEAKDMPDYMVMDSDPMKIELKYNNGPAEPQHALLAFATGSEAPDPQLVGLLPEYECVRPVERRDEAMHQRRRCTRASDFL